MIINIFQCYFLDHLHEITDINFHEHIFYFFIFQIYSENCTFARNTYIHTYIHTYIYIYIFLRPSFFIRTKRRFFIYLSNSNYVGRKWIVRMCVCARASIVRECNENWMKEWRMGWLLPSMGHIEYTIPNCRKWTVKREYKMNLERFSLKNW